MPISPSHIPPALERVAQNAISARKEKKRTRDTDDGDVTRKKKKKSKVQEDHNDDGVAQARPAVSQDAPVIDSEEAPKKKKRKSTKKGKERAVETDPVTQSAADAADKTAHLLSAILSATTEHSRHGTAQQPVTGQTSMPRMENPDAFLAGMVDPALSNDDILRALQELDLSKIASVLKTIGDAATPVAPNANLPNFFVADESTAVHNHDPSASTVIDKGGKPGTSTTNKASAGTAGQSSLAPKVLQNRVLDMTLPPPAKEANRDAGQAQLLATRWLTPGKLAELVEKDGLVYKKGKFSALEVQQLYSAIDNYRLSNGLQPRDIERIIFDKSTTERDNSFWTEITYAVPLRPMIAIYHHVRRAFHPLKMQGKWTPSEDARLEQAVAELGMAWEKVSQRVGRMAADCRDRYRNHITGKQTRARGPWTKEEEDDLTQIVTEMTIDQGRDPDNDVFWTQVVEKMGHRRSRQQCRIKWTDALSKKVKNHGTRPRWSQRDAYILVHKIASLNVRDDSEIDWRLVPDSEWNLWSAHVLQRRWVTMKRSIKGYEEMTHQEIMDILRTKKSHCPPASVARKAATSAETIDDEEDEAGEGGGEMPIDPRLGGRGVASVPYV